MVLLWTDLWSSNAMWTIAEVDESSLIYSWNEDECQYVEDDNSDRIMIFIFWVVAKVISVFWDKQEVSSGYKMNEETYVNPLERGVCKIDDIFWFPWRLGSKVKNKLNNHANRNAIQTPLSTQFNVVLNWREVSYKVSDVLMWRYERINVWLWPLNWLNTLFDAFIWEKDDIRNFKNIWENQIPSYDASLTKWKDKVYRSWIWISEKSFIRLKDKWLYIEQKKRDLFNELQQYTINNLMYSRKLTSNDEVVLTEINDLYNMWYISILEIQKIINIWLRKKSDSIFWKITKNNVNFDSLDIWIIGWGILNWAFLEPIIKELEKVTWKSRDFFTKYVEGLNYVELIFSLIIKQS